ncbi:MAG: hypothetical protein ACKVT2_22915 [Saprospiraceae bacterium]
MMNIEHIKPQDLTIAKFLALFNQFSRTEQVQIAQSIWEKTFAEQWNQLDAELPDVKISDEEIMQELIAVRYGEAAKA